MTESVQRLRTNRTIEGRECGWCHVPLDFGDPAVVCQACSSVTHGVCWDAKGGCPTDECVNRPLRKLDEPAAPSPLAELQAIPPSPAGNQAAGGTLYDPGVASRPGGTPYQPAAAVSPAAAQAGETLYEPGAMMHGLKKTCPHCGLQIDADSMLCRYCNMVPTPDGIYRGPKTNAPGAVASLVFGILAFFICGIIFGLLAISKANEAKKAIAADPRLGGEGLANAGRILGILALVAWGAMLLFRLSQL